MCYNGVGREKNTDDGGKTGMKLISFTVPCYNSQDYMKKCIDSLLSGGDEVEVIIVNDGSTDATLQIAREYERNAPASVKVVDKPNGGHGSGINAGLNIAEGIYFKVVDSDDWLDRNALSRLLETIRRHKEEGVLPDLYITNFIYDHASDNTQYVSRYDKKFPVGKLCRWEEAGKFRFSHMMLMHALLYKRENLLMSGTVMPEHTFYCDNLFAYRPLPFMKTLFYLDVDLYHYFIGRADQSVNINNFTKRYAQQQRVMLLMTDSYSLEEIKKMPSGLRRYLWHSLEVIMMNTVFFTCAADGTERRQSLKDLWRHIRANDKAMYKKLRRRSYATAVNYLPWKVRGAVMKCGYKILCKKIKLG